MSRARLARWLLALPALAAPLLASPLSAAEPPATRTVTMRIAVDAAYRAQPDWEARLRTMVATVSDVWERAFRIRWAIADIVEWSAPPLRLDPRRSFHELDQDDLDGEADALLLVSGQSCDTPWRGLARGFGHRAIVKPLCSHSSASPPEAALSHELAHLFGAFHPFKGPSVMATTGGAVGQFDRQAARVIRLTRGMDLKRGVESLDESARRAWQAIYGEGHYPGDPNMLAVALGRAGRDRAAAGDRDRGEALLREALRVDPSLAIAHVDLGRVLEARRRRAEAIAEYRAGVQADPKLAAAPLQLGLALQQVPSERAQAIEPLRAAIRLEPGWGLPRAALAWVLVQQGRSREAGEEMQAALRLTPGDAAVRWYIGEILREHGDRAQAVMLGRQVVRVRPRWAPGHVLLGAALSATGKVDESLAALRTAVRLDPELPSAQHQLAVALWQSGDPAGALQSYREALRLDPELVNARVDLARMLMQQQRLDDAVTELRQAVRADPGSSRAQGFFGLALLERGHLDEAIAAFYEVVRLEPRGGGAHYQLARAHAAAGRYREAWDAVERARGLGFEVPAAFVEALTRQMPEPARQ
jgi:tetratricopeptide (TPR) repeat protein